MPDLIEAIDALLADQGGLTGAQPPPRSHLNNLQGAAFALLAIVRAAPDANVRVLDCSINAHSGQITLQVDGAAHAERIAERLGLRESSLGVTEIDDGWLSRRWPGLWADWPITVMCTWREPELTA